MSGLTAILYVRLPGLLTAVIRANGNLSPATPLAVATERTILDVCPEASRQGVRVGESTMRARRLCPSLLVIPHVAVPRQDASSSELSLRLLNTLASLSPTVEPDNTDAAYADLTGGPLPDLTNLVAVLSLPETGFAPVIGLGSSRVAGRACAECKLPAEHLAEAHVRWLWPEDAKIAARLFRLGLATFGDVAALGEEALVFQFGKIGRLLYQRSMGKDFTPVRPLWPPAQVETYRDFALEPIRDERYLSEALARLAKATADQLHGMRRHSRRLHLAVRTERSDESASWVLPFPVQNEKEIATALRRLRQQMTLKAPVTRIQVLAHDLDLPPATTASLFDERAVERKLALAATRQRLHARYGIQSLRTLGELPISERDIRRSLWKERLEA